MQSGADVVDKKAIEEIKNVAIDLITGRIKAKDAPNLSANLAEILDKYPDDDMKNVGWLRALEYIDIFPDIFHLIQNGSWKYQWSFRFPFCRNVFIPSVCKSCGKDNIAFVALVASAQNFGLRINDASRVDPFYSYEDYGKYHHHTEWVCTDCGEYYVGNVIRLRG